MTETGALLMFAIAAGAVGYVVRVIATTILKHKQIDAANDQGADSVPDQRMARLEMAVESIALEVERISEGQRFTTKLLSDAAKGIAPRLERPKKQDTPH